MKAAVRVLALCLIVTATAKAYADRLFAVHVSIWGKPTITELDPATGAVVRSYPTPAQPNQNAGLAFDGTHLYFLSGSSPTYNTIYKLNPDTGTVLGQYNLPENQYRTGLAIIGSHLYALDWHPHHNNIEVYDLASGSHIRTMNFPAANPGETNRMLDGGLGEIAVPEALLAASHPVGANTPTEVLFLDPLTAAIQGRFGILDADAEHGARGLTSIGQEIFLGLHVTRDGKQIVVYDKYGVEQRRFGVSGSTGVQALAGWQDPVPEPPAGAALCCVLTLLAWRNTWRRIGKRNPA